MLSHMFKSYVVYFYSSKTTGTEGTLIAEGNAHTQKAGHMQKPAATQVHTEGVTTQLISFRNQFSALVHGLRAASSGDRLGRGGLLRRIGSRRPVRELAGG